MYSEWEQHKGMVGCIAKRHMRPGLTHEELHHVGMIGLWEAAQRFDDGNGTKLETFAKHRVEGQMKDLIRETFGRGGEHCQPPITRPRGCRDAGLKAVDDRDEIEG